MDVSAMSWHVPLIEMLHALSVSLSVEHNVFGRTYAASSPAPQLSERPYTMTCASAASLKRVHAAWTVVSAMSWHVPLIEMLHAPWVLLNVEQSVWSPTYAAKSPAPQLSERP